MAWIKTISDEQATGEVAVEFDAARRRAGRVYNIIRVMSVNPKVLRSSMGLYVSLMHGPSPLPRATREMIATVVSLTNKCHY